MSSVAEFLLCCLVGGVALGLLIGGLLVAYAKAMERYEDLSRGDTPEDMP